MSSFFVKSLVFAALSLARATGSLAGGFLVAVAGCARVAVSVVCSCWCLCMRLLRNGPTCQFHLLTCTMGFAPIKRTCTIQIRHFDEDSLLTGP